MSAVREDLSFLLRPMLESDLDEIMAIERLAYNFPWSAGIFTDCLNVGYCCWVLQAEASIGGYGVMTVSGAEAHLLNICIRGDLRRNGYGRSLLNYLFDIARKHNAQKIFLEVRPTNEIAIELYKDLGFREIGIRREYYPAPIGKEDALVLSKSLSPAHRRWVRVNRS